MSNLKQQLIRLGAQKPTLRGAIRPILAHMKEAEDLDRYVAQMAREYKSILTDALNKLIASYRRSKETSARNWRGYVAAEEFKGADVATLVKDIEYAVAHELALDLPRRRPLLYGDKLAAFKSGLWDYLLTNGDTMVYPGFSRDFRKHGDR